MSDEPESVRIVLEPRNIPDERIEAWKDDWQELSMADRSHYEDINEYLEERAIEWTRECFMQAQGDHDAHLWMEEYEVNYDE